MENINVQIAQTVQPMLTVEIVQNLVPVMTAEVVIGGGQKITFGDTMTGAGTPTDPVNVSNDIITQITNNTEQAQTNASQIANIQSVIPESASAENQLTTREYVNNAILALPQYKIQVVSALPATGAEYILYLVPKAGDSNDIYDEYIWVPDIASFELIGTTAVDLSGYLPLSGGTLTGPVVFKGTESSVRIGANTTGNGLMLNGSITVTDYSVLPPMAGFYDANLGGSLSSLSWDNIYVKNIANGSGGKIAVPSSAGTLARIEDIPQASALPEATADNVGAVIQYIGETDDSYTQGYFYKNTATTTDDTTTYAWVRIDVQPGLKNRALSDTSIVIADGGSVHTTGGGGNVMIGPNLYESPQNGQTIIGATSNSSYSWTVCIGYNATSHAGSTIAVGPSSAAWGTGSIAIGTRATTTGDYSVQLGAGTNSDANTFKVGNDNGNFEMMDADGNVPLDRLTYVTNQIGDISTALAAIIGE